MRWSLSALLRVCAGRMSQRMSQCDGVLIPMPVRQPNLSRVSMTQQDHTGQAPEGCGMLRSCSETAQRGNRASSTY